MEIADGTRELGQDCWEDADCVSDLVCDADAWECSFEPRGRARKRTPVRDDPHPQVIGGIHRRFSASPPSWRLVLIPDLPSASLLKSVVIFLLSWTLGRLRCDAVTAVMSATLNNTQEVGLRMEFIQSH